MNIHIDPDEHGRSIARQHHATQQIPWRTIITLAAIAGLLAIVLRTSWRIIRAIFRPVINLAYWLVRLVGNLIEHLLDVALRVGIAISLLASLIYFANHYGHLLRHL